MPSIISYCSLRSLHLYTSKSTCINEPLEVLTSCTISFVHRWEWSCYGAVAIRNLLDMQCLMMNYSPSVTCTNSESRLPRTPDILFHADTMARLHVWFWCHRSTLHEWLYICSRCSMPGAHGCHTAVSPMWISYSCGSHWWCISQFKDD